MWELVGSDGSQFSVLGSFLIVHRPSSICNLQSKICNLQSETAMQCLLIYDIPHDGTRQKIADACLDYGLERIQFSAFCGNLSRAHQRELLKIVQRRLGRHAGNIQFFPLDEFSWSGRRIIAQEEPHAHDD
jgi:CRISPR-associated protein Cas2